LVGAHRSAGQQSTRIELVANMKADEVIK